MRKKLLAVVLAITSLTLMCGCEVTVKNEDDEYKEKYEALTSELQSAYQEYADQTYLSATAKKIHTAMSAYLTQLGIKDEPIPNDFTYANYKEELIDYLPAEVYVNDKLEVDWEYNSDTYAGESVTVTYEDMTATYPEQ